VRAALLRLIPRVLAYSVPLPVRKLRLEILGFHILPQGGGGGKNHAFQRRNVSWREEVLLLGLTRAEQVAETPLAHREQENTKGKRREKQARHLWNWYVPGRSFGRVKKMKTIVVKNGV